jgi:mono/diheme cytochrome c family protein
MSSRYLPLVFVGSVLVVPACGGADLGECPPDSAAQQLTGRQVVETYCLSCHSSALSGAARQGAPGDLNFDDLATVRDEAESMYSETEGGSMPPAGGVSGAPLEAMRVWLACGAPDVKP